MQHNNRPKRVDYARCGTEEDWEKYRLKYPGTERVIPAKIYVSETGICLVTSQDWVNWLTGKRENMP